MEQNHTNTDLIDKHLAGKLTREERLLFEEKMSEPGFKELLAEMKEIKAGIASFELRRMKGVLEEEELAIKQSTLPSDSKSKFTLPAFFKIAVAVIGLSLGIWWIVPQLTENQQDYFAQYFSPQKNTLSIIDKGATDTDEIKEAFSEYSNEDYKTFLKKIEPILQENDNDDYRFYQANALLATRSVEDAIIILKQIISNNQSEFLEESKWLLALSYLHEKQNEEAIPLLESMTDVYFKSNANLILKDIKNKD